ncbi:MAG: alpha/beta hydrolase, partial [Chloroflexota bacterium]
MPYADLPGVRLWYEDSGGTGPPVVFLHAFSGTSQSWVHQVPAFARAGYRCLAPDRREWGRSTLNPASPITRTDTEDLDALVNLLRLERLHLVATAAGAVTGFDYALTHPERVRSLVVANTVGGVQDEAYIEVQHRLRPAEIQALPVFLRELSAGYRGP